MKTLDEVIKAVDYCTFSSDCNPCPYKEDKECSRAKMTDALHYLKEYRTILPLVPSLINTALEVQKKGKTIG